jgi:lipopolysaccharide transport system ATP-binding protein
MTTVRFENVSKVFRQRHAYAPDNDLWALRDVSFECGEGEVLGLIGRNGCGKSTLLKLAARVTSPTRGVVTCVKPVAPMLELGAGFHPDLSGRDNIQLNGCLLGLGWHIKPSLIDEIVAFAEVEQHVDTPVKHYSSGMYARLGFAVAVHSPARLLLVDEVLSVGDKLFQQKCFARMQYLRDQGTTIVLVSHDNWWIRNFCKRVLVMDAGQVIADGNPEEALQAYRWRLRGFSGDQRSGIAIQSVEVFDPDGARIGPLPGTAVRVRITYEAGDAPVDWLFVARVRREDGIYCATCVSPQLAISSAGIAIVEIADLYLEIGRYVMEVSIEDAKSLVPLAAQISETFAVKGHFDLNRGYEGVIKTRHQWTFD